MKNEIEITSVLKELGIPANVKGYFCLKFAISKMIEDMSLMSAITTRLYPMIAKEYDLTVSRAERVVRYAIEIGWTRGNIAAQNNLFGFSVDLNKGLPTNSEFIVTVADYILMTRNISIERVVTSEQKP